MAFMVCVRDAEQAHQSGNVAAEAQWVVVDMALCSCAKVETELLNGGKTSRHRQQDQRRATWLTPLLGLWTPP